jgi:hypothetical protein
MAGHHTSSTRWNHSVETCSQATLNAAALLQILSAETGVNFSLQKHFEGVANGVMHLVSTSGDHPNTGTTFTFAFVGGNSNLLSLDHLGNL